MEFSDMHFSEAPLIKVDPPGPRARELIEMQLKLESNAVLYPRKVPLVIDEAKGATIRDVDGNIYIDFFSGISVLNFGHSNPVIVEAARRQLEKLAHALDFPTEPRLELTKLLRDIAPLGLKGRCKVLYGGPTGSDAIEAAVKLAKYNTRKHGLLAFEGSYHGQTAAALSLTSSRSFKDKYIPMLPEVHFSPYAYCYRCPLGLSYPECSIQCVRYLEKRLKDPYSGLPDLAAIIVEPVQGEGGVIVPPDEFLKEVRRIASEHSIPLVIDEIQAGLCRTGKIFACEHYETTPDVMTLAKSLGGGMPLAACLYREDLDTWEPGSHLGTFRGHAVAMAAGVAAMKFMLDYKLWEHTASLGELAIKRLEEVASESEVVGDVRGKGLMLALELVKDTRTKEPWPDGVKRVQRECFRRGVIVWTAGHYGNVVRLLPPLVITRIS